MAKLVKRVQKYKKPDRNSFSGKKKSQFSMASYSFMIPVFKILGIIGFVSGLIRGCVYIIQVTVFSPEYMIQRVTYADESIAIYDNPDIYSEIKKAVSGSNYYLTRYRNNRSIEKKIEEAFPIVQNLHFAFGGKNTIHVTIKFNQPELRIRNQQDTFAYYQSHFYETFSGNTLGSGVEEILLPYYASGATGMQGVFFDIDPTILIGAVRSIYTDLPNTREIAYLPASQRIRIVLRNNQIIYINYAKDIPQQLHSLSLLQEYYNQFSTLKEIDVGSLEYNQIIVKK